MIQVNPDKQITTSDITAGGGNLDTIITDVSTIVKGTITNILVPTRADVLDVYKAGRVVQVVINNVIYSSSFSTDTAIFTLPYKPAMINTMDVGARFILFNQDATLSFGFVKASNGNVYLNNYTGNKLLYGNIVYLTND